MQISLLQAALEYAALGWPVFPLHTPTDGGCSCGKADCSSIGKHPRTQNGVKDASIDEDQVTTWWEMWPQANIGIACGPPVLVLDVDGPEGLDSIQGKQLPPTPTVSTGKGRHYYYAHPDSAVKNAVRTAPGLDIRAAGGYVVAPPSVHASGRVYAWDDYMSPQDCDLAPVPDWLSDLLTQPKQRTGSASSPTPSEIPQGQRNNALASLAGTLRNAGLGPDEILAALREANQQRCNPPLPDGELEKISQSIGRREARRDFVQDTAEQEAKMAALVAQAEAEKPQQEAPRPRPYPYTDLGNAERMVDLYGDRIRYCHPQRIWYCWDGKRWKADDTGAITRLATSTVRKMGRQLGDMEKGSDEAKDLWKHCLKSENAARLRAMEELARSVKGIPVVPKALDANPWLFNCSNGAIDLKTGEIQPHRQTDMMTKMSPVKYDPSARSELWEQFLARVTDGDQELQLFLQTVAGYSLTGLTVEDKLLFVHGPTRSGKSTFLDALGAMMGDYAMTSTVQAFMDARSSGGASHSEQIAVLAGARMVTATEPAPGRKWDEEIVKQLTGGDTIRARNLYSDSFEFKPRFKLFVAANDRPRVRYDSSAMWERILEVPFPSSIPPEERDPALKLQLQDPQQAGAGILAWAVEGCLLWQAEGLRIPGVVQEASAIYRQEMDPLQDFFQERVTFHADAFTGGTALWEAYKEHCDDSGIRYPMLKRDFKAAVADRGVAEGRDSSGKTRGWRGIGLVSSDNPDKMEL